MLKFTLLLFSTLISIILSQEMNNKDSFDFIIVGGGSAGAVLANRLSEELDWRVLLVEAGSEQTPASYSSHHWSYFMHTSVDWEFYTQPDDRMFLGLKNKVNYWPRGKILGGSSSTNAMLYQRGNDRDYNDWEQAGNPDWGFKNVFPYFLKSEDFQGMNRFDPKFHNAGGYLTVSPHASPDKNVQVINAAAKELKTDTILDLNRDQYLGFGFFDTTTRNGLRCSSAEAFLHPARFRQNLVIWKETRVTKILIDGKLKAYGIEYVNSQGETSHINCTKEVILSAGAVGSPQLLMLSGIGPLRHLEERGIFVIQNLPVGENLQDHVCFPGVVFSGNKGPNESKKFRKNKIAATNKGFTTKKVGKHVGFIDTKRSSLYPNIELMTVNSPFNANQKNNNRSVIGSLFSMSDEVADLQDSLNTKSDLIYLIPILLKPKSRGKILLSSKNYAYHPQIHPKYFSDNNGEDLDTMIEAIDFLIAMNGTVAFKEKNLILQKIDYPECSKYNLTSREYWACGLSYIAGTFWHPVGTCKMGAADDPTSVVDPYLKVKGILGLRVIDASIMPTIISGHINAATVMIGEKGADTIKLAYNKSIEPLPSY